MSPQKEDAQVENDVAVQFSFFLCSMQSEHMYAWTCVLQAIAAKSRIIVARFYGDRFGRENPNEEKNKKTSISLTNTYTRHKPELYKYYSLLMAMLVLARVIVFEQKALLVLLKITFIRHRSADDTAYAQFLEMRKMLQ